MTGPGAVTLSWPDPEDASEFLALRDRYRRDRWLPDPSRDALLDLIRSSDVAGENSSEEGSPDAR